MIHIKHEDLNKAKKKVLYLLNFKYKDENLMEENDFENNRDTSVEGSFKNIISLLDNSSRLLFQIITMIRKEEDKIVSRAVYEPKLDDDGNQFIDDDGYEVLKKKKVPRLDEDGNQVYGKNGHPMFDTVKEDVLVEGNRYYRNINAYMTFNQYIYDILKNVKNVNIIFKEIISDIGFVEPEDIQTYKDAFEEFENNMEDVAKKITVNGKFKVIFKDANNEVDKENLKQAIRSLGKEEAKLVEYNENINQNYNYKPSNLNNKTKAKIFTEDKKREQLEMPIYDDEN